MTAILALLILATAANVEDFSRRLGKVFPDRVHRFDEVAHPEHITRLAAIAIDRDRIVL